MAENNATPSVAAERFGVTRQGIAVAWRRLFGDEPTPTQTEMLAKQAEIVRLVEGGATLTETCTQLGVSADLVRSVCAEFKLTIISARTKRRARLQKAIAAMQQGMLAPDAAAAFGLTDGYLKTKRREKYRPRKPQDYTSRRDGRGLRAALRVETGMSMHDACVTERVAAPGVRAILKRRREERAQKSRS